MKNSLYINHLRIQYLINNNLCCKICNKYYKSKNSLCNHNKKYHYVIKYNH